MIAVIQIVRRRWPKAERAAEFAQKRSGLPWTYPADPEQPELRTTQLRTTLFDLNVVEEGVLSSYEGHDLTFRDGNLGINVVRIDRYHHQDHRVVEIPLNQWIQLIHNFRETDQDGAWYFGEYRLNVGLFAPFSPTVFLDLEPSKVCDLRKHINSIKPFTKSG